MQEFDFKSWELVFGIERMENLGQILEEFQKEKLLIPEFEGFWKALMETIVKTNQDLIVEIPNKLVEFYSNLNEAFWKGLFGSLTSNFQLYNFFVLHYHLNFLSYQAENLSRLQLAKIKALLMFPSKTLELKPFLTFENNVL